TARPPGTSRAEGGLGVRRTFCGRPATGWAYRGSRAGSASTARLLRPGRARLAAPTTALLGRQHLITATTSVRTRTEDREMLNVFHREGEIIRHFWGAELTYVPADPGQDHRGV